MAIEDNRSGDQAIPERFFAETSIALRSGKSKAIKLAESVRKPAERPAVGAGLESLWPERVANPYAGRARDSALLTRPSPAQNHCGPGRRPARPGCRGGSRIGLARARCQPICWQNPGLGVTDPPFPGDHPTRVLQGRVGAGKIPFNISHHAGPRTTADQGGDPPLLEGLAA